MTGEGLLNSLGHPSVRIAPGLLFFFHFCTFVMGCPKPLKLETWLMFKSCGQARLHEAQVKHHFFQSEVNDVSQDCYSTGVKGPESNFYGDSDATLRATFGL